MRRTLNTEENSIEKGFTLVEMAVVILLVGLAIAALSPLYNVHVKKENFESTQIGIENASSAIGAFRSLNGRYPCPASLTAVRGDANYGREDCSDMSAVNAGDAPLNGIYIENSIRAPFEFEDPVTGVVDTRTARVRVGFLPFRHLALEEDDAYDGHNNRILYAVTEHLAFSDSFHPTGGGIEILNDLGESALGDAGNVGTAHFMILSPGESNAGAFSRAGTQLPCPIGAFETENCNFGDGQAIYQFSQTNTSGDALTGYDDTIDYFTHNSIPMWQLSDTTGDVGNIHNKVPGNVGIHTDDISNVEEESEIIGTVRAKDDDGTAAETEGKLVAEALCEEDGAECFNPRIFAGMLDDPGIPGDDSTGGMKCPEGDPDGVGEFMVGIRNGAPICEDEVIVRCGQEEFLQGINNDGSPNCAGAPPDGCATETVEICGEDGTLPASSHGTIYTLEGGDNREEIYQCLDGTWEGPSASNGNCVCTPGIVTTTHSCGVGNEPGDYTITYETICPSGEVITTNGQATDCVCIDGYVDDRYYSCPIGHTGERILRRIRSCPNWGSWFWAVNTCTCEESTQILNRSCPPNESGVLQQERNFICPEAQYVWGDVVTDTCACVETTEIRNEDCPAGQTGAIQEEWQFNCTTFEWDYVQEVANSCRNCQWSAGTSSTTSEFSIGPEAGDICTCGAAPQACHERVTSGVFRNYPSCTCE